MALNKTVSPADAAIIRAMREAMKRGGHRGTHVAGAGGSHYPDGSSLYLNEPVEQDLEFDDSDWVLFQLTSSAAGGGKYYGKLYTDYSTAVPTGNLAESDFGTLATDENCLCLNTREVGKATHDLETSGYLPTVFTGFIIGATTDGKYIVVFDGLQQEDCTLPGGGG